MPRPLRVRFAGAYYHIFNRGVERRSIYEDVQDRKLFVHYLEEAVLQFNVDVFAYCLMDNHYHLFLKTNDVNLDKFVQKMQGRFVQYFNLRHNRVGGLFQGRYKSRVVDSDSYALTVTRYIHRNALEIPGVKCCEDYPWSSYSAYLGNQNSPKWLKTDEIMSMLEPNKKTAKQAFVDFHKMVPEGSDPYGTKEWIG
jgi:putative transposase